jgi:anion-transporting  ArsA/GET3 family ATPase
MVSLLERKLIVVTGKGGTGKTTIACALGLLAARGGRRTIVVELGDQHRLPGLFAREDVEGASGSDGHRAGAEIELQEGLWSTSIDPEKALGEWLQALGGRLTGRMLAASSTFQYFAAAAPGTKELVCMVKVCELCERDGRGRGGEPYDLVVLDAPATGHALAMLRSPQTFATIVRAGPLAEQAQRVRGLLEDPERCGYVAVTHASEMAVNETLELEYGLRAGVGRDFDAIIVNGTLPRRFSKQDIGRVLAAAENTGNSTDACVLAAAAGAAQTMYRRAQVQQSQIARLRRRTSAGDAGDEVITVPFAFAEELNLAVVRQIAADIARRC